MLAAHGGRREAESQGRDSVRRGSVGCVCVSVCDALVQAVTEKGAGQAQEHASSRYDESIRRSAERR